MSEVLFFFKRFLRSTLWFFNLKLVEVTLAEKFLLQFSKKYNSVKFLQIGANDGISFDCLYEYVTKYQWSGVVVEPLTDFYQRLCINYEDYPLVKPVNIAVHPTAEVFNLYRVDSKFYGELPDWTKGTATFDYNNLIKQGIKAHQITLNSVPSIPLMDLVEKYSLYDIDYLQIDVEGMDADIIKMIDFSKLKPLLIRFEWQHLKNNDMNLVINILKNEGYLIKMDSSDCFAFQKKLIIEIYFLSEFIL